MESVWGEEQQCLCALHCVCVCVTGRLWFAGVYCGISESILVFDVSAVGAAASCVV